MRKYMPIQLPGCIINSKIGIIDSIIDNVVYSTDGCGKNMCRCIDFNKYCHIMTTWSGIVYYSNGSYLTP